MLTVRNCQILNKYSTMASTTCSWCYKTFFEGNSRFPLKPKQQEYAILKVLNSFRVDFCFKIALFSHFCAGSHIRTKFIQFLSFGESRFPPKKVLQHQLDPDPIFQNARRFADSDVVWNVTLRRGAGTWRASSSRNQFCKTDFAVTHLPQKITARFWCIMWVWNYL